MRPTLKDMSFFLRYSVVAIGLALGVAHDALSAQTSVYEWRDASGVISYSQFAPPAGVKNLTVRQIDTKDFTPAQRLAIEAQLLRDDKALADTSRIRERIASADAAVDLALVQLAQAERALKGGREPLPGERLHNAGGGSRLLASFFTRQRQLAETAQQAREQLTEAYRLRDAIQP